MTSAPVPPPSGPWALLGPLPLGTPGLTCRDEPPRRSSRVAVLGGADRTVGHRAQPVAHGAAHTSGAGHRSALKALEVNYPLTERARRRRAEEGRMGGAGPGFGPYTRSRPYGLSRPRPSHPHGISSTLPRPAVGRCGSVEGVERTRFARRLKKQRTVSVQVAGHPRDPGRPSRGVARPLAPVLGLRARFRAAGSARRSAGPVGPLGREGLPRCQRSGDTGPMGRRVVQVLPTNLASPGLRRQPLTCERHRYDAPEGPGCSRAPRSVSAVGRGTTTVPSTVR